MGERTAAESIPASEPSICRDSAQVTEVDDSEIIATEWYALLII